MSVKISGDAGVTLVEVLTVMVLSSILIGFFLHADLAVNRSILRWIRRSNLEQASLTMVRLLQRDIASADSILARSDGIIEMFRMNMRLTEYRFSNSRVERNGTQLLPDAVLVSDFTCSPLNSRPDLQPTEEDVQANQHQILTFTLKRDDFVTQTITLPIRPYHSRQIE